MGHAARAIFFCADVASSGGIKRQHSVQSLCRREHMIVEGEREGKIVLGQGVTAARSSTI
jgi:hypothetical protein